MHRKLTASCTYNEIFFHSTGTECIDCFPVDSAPTIDGGTFDWVSVQSFEYPLTHALDRSEYAYGNLKMKCVHDSKRVYFLFEVPGPFRFDPENNHRCPSVSTMFKMGPDAMYYVSAFMSTRPLSVLSSI